MKLIKSIDIGYFRSIYKERLDKLGPLSILFGRNDSGKSNVLRALNLFFNSETNPGQPFVFSRDLCHARSQEASKKTDARKFVSVKVTFRMPSEWHKSLGNELYVKKTWSQLTGDEPNIDSPIDESKRQYLTRFLNKVHFHYVPAVKDRRIFEELLGDVYSVLSVDKQFVGSLDTFSVELKRRTEILTSELHQSIHLSSAIVPPTELKELFKSLDFETRGESDRDPYSLTLQRGDGIQMRHIPAILKFVCDESKQPYHIWGFEEPENSLELANAVEEAAAFERYSQKANIQAFVTSHSPAFFNLSSASTSRFFVSRTIKTPLELPTSRIQAIESNDSNNELMGETPHLAVVSQYLREASRAIEALKKDQKTLCEEIAKTHQPIVFVEGESDKIILEVAWKMFKADPQPFSVVECSGTTKMNSLAADGPVISTLTPERLICCCVDNDIKGRSLYKNAKLNVGAKWIQHNSNGTYWCLWKPTKEFDDEMKNLGIPPDKWPFVLESSFTTSIRQEAQREGAYALEDVPHDELLDSSVYKKIAGVLQTKGFSKRSYLMKTHKDMKVPFAHWVERKAEEDASILEPFRTIIEGLGKLIESRLKLR